MNTKKQIKTQNMLLDIIGELREQNKSLISHNRALMEENHNLHLEVKQLNYANKNLIHSKGKSAIFTVSDVKVGK